MDGKKESLQRTRQFSGRPVAAADLSRYAKKEKRNERSANDKIKIQRISYFSLVKLLFFGSLPVIAFFCLIVLIVGNRGGPTP